MVRSPFFPAMLLVPLLPAIASADVRVLHLSPNTPAVDVLAGLSEDAKAPLVQGAEYTNVTDYLPVPTGNYFIDVTPAGDPDTVAIDINDLPLDGDLSYSVAAIGLLGGDPALGPLLLIDDAFASDQAQLRIIHASPDAGSVDVLVNGGVALDGFEFGTATDYLALDPGAYDLEIIQESTGDTLFSVNGLELSSGLVASAFAIGTVESTDTAPFDVLITADATAVPEPCSAVLLALSGLIIGRRRHR